MNRFDPRGRVNRALLVGVSEYDHTRPAEPDGVPGGLPGVRHNLNRLRDVLRSGGAVDEREITVCRSPSLDDFSEELRTAAQEAEGLLLCYFAGHGAVPSAGDELFLQMRNARVVAGGRAVFPGAVAFTGVLTELAGSRAERVVVILDCCYAGNADKIWHDFADRRQKILLLMSVQANRLIDSGDGTRPTPFTDELVQLLDVDGELSFLELFERLRGRMAAAGHTTTLGDLWEPQHAGEPGTDVLLAARAVAPQGDESAQAVAHGPGPAPLGEGLPGRAAPPEQPEPSQQPEPSAAPRSPEQPLPPSQLSEQPLPPLQLSEQPLPPSQLSEQPLPPLQLSEQPLPPPQLSEQPLPPPQSSEQPAPFPQSSEQPAPSSQSSEQPPRTERPESARPTGSDSGSRNPLRALLGPLRTWIGALIRWFGGLRVRVRVAVSATLVLALVALSLGCYKLIGFGDDHSCAPPLELRLLTDPDLEPTVRAAADAYLTSDANTTGHGCRRTGITVYSAGAATAVGALHQQTGAWQEPREEDTNPQRDVGPQPDVWIPASITDVARVTTDQTDRVFTELGPDTEPFVYSPVVLAVPQNIAGAGLDQRVGRPLAQLIADLKKQDPTAELRRSDPEVTDSALLATIGLYGGGTADPRSAEQGVRPTGPPAPMAADLLCTLPDDHAADNRTAALVPEFLLKSGVGCAGTTRVPRTAEYPDDVPGLTPTFVRVHWEGAVRDAAARVDAVARFHDWLTGKEGLAAFRSAGFRSASGSGHPLLDTDHPGDGVLRNPSPLPGSAGQAAMDTALERYRSANGPGRVLYLLDSSGSMTAQWQGPSGGPGILKQSLGGLGTQDEYGVWAVYGTSGDRRYDMPLPFGHHRRGEAEHAIDTKAQVRDAEADPHAALLAALDDMARRGTDDKRPQLIVYITDDEDDNRLTGRNLDDVLARARQEKVPVDMVSLASGSCDKGRPDARIAEASGGRCLDAGDDLGTGLHDEVARVGTGED
ncbi:caspase family protein [Streptomyces sp. NPDC005202]|uniref:caspase family protein n=1 Tax=Streptomyces sp. NPDC005202 TaxID=3157021 RepID=UPI0033B5CA29